MVSPSRCRRSVINASITLLCWFARPVALGTLDWTGARKAQWPSLSEGMRSAFDDGGPGILSIAKPFATTPSNGRRANALNVIQRDCLPERRDLLTRAVGKRTMSSPFVQLFAQNETRPLFR